MTRRCYAGDSHPTSCTASELRQEALAAARGLTAGDNALVEVLRELERERGRATEAARSVVRALAATLQARDGYTGDHADAVHDLSVAVGARLGLTAPRWPSSPPSRCCTTSARSASPTRVLHKPGPLDDDEWELMREHPVIGERILAAVPGLEAVARAVRHEHERWDGDGYPDGLRGEDDPAGLADRPGLRRLARARQRPPLPHGPRRATPRSPSCARCAGTQFDPGVVAALLDVARATPRPAMTVSEPPGPRRAARDVVGGGTSLERELVALIAVASAVAAAHKLDEVIEVAAEEALRRDRRRVAVDRALVARARHPAHAHQRRRPRARRGAPPGRRDLPARRRRRDLRARARGGRHVLLLPRRPRHRPTIERDAAASRSASTPRVAVPIMFGDETWGQIWAARHRRPAAVRRARRALPARDQRPGRRGDRARRGVLARLRAGPQRRADRASRTGAPSTRRSRSPRSRRAATATTSRCVAVRHGQPQGHQRPPRPRGRRRRARARSPTRWRKSAGIVAGRRSSAASAATSSRCSCTAAGRQRRAARSPRASCAACELAPARRRLLRRRDAARRRGPSRRPAARRRRRPVRRQARRPRTRLRRRSRRRRPGVVHGAASGRAPARAARRATVRPSTSAGC